VVAVVAQVEVAVAEVAKVAKVEVEVEVAPP
jgi:hypothetical protein